MEKIYGYISKKFKKKVLENAKESDQIIIITGYFSPDMIDEIAKMGVPFVYYYGMYGIDKIAKPVYDKLISINNSNSNLKLKFVHTQRVHTKCYLFYKNTKLENALVGSANCSINGLCSIENAEMLIELNKKSSINQFKAGRLMELWGPAWAILLPFFLLENNRISVVEYFECSSFHDFANSPSNEI